MTAFDGARTADDPGICPARLPNPERLARMAEADNWLYEPPPCRRRRLSIGQQIARLAAFLGGVAAAAWLVSGVAVWLLLDEARLAMLGVTP